MRAWGKRLHSASATVGVSDSAPKTKTRRSGRCCWSKSASSSCWRTKEGVDAQAWQALSDYGQALGVAFQVVDDILDVVADSATLGKTAGKDQANDKPTYVSLLGLDQARAHADELCALAHAALARSGLPDTRALAALADMVVSRTH